MAFVKLPEDIRFLDLSSTLGDRKLEPLEFAVFSGSASWSEDGAHLTLTSPWGAERFDAVDAPVAFREGDAGAVMAILPPNDESGPIISAANLDMDERADLLSRENAILAAVGRAPRRKSLLSRLGVLIGAVFTAVIAAAFCYGAAAIAQAGLSVGFDDLLTLGDETINRAYAMSPVLIVLAGLAATLSLIAGFARRGIRAQREKRALRRALDTVWDNAADAMAFVQAHREMFRAAPAANAPKNRLQEIGRKLSNGQSRRRVTTVSADQFDDDAFEDRGERDLVDPHSVIEQPGAVKMPAFLQ